MKLKDIRVGKRLFIGFGIMNFILVGICVFGLSMITGVNGSLEQIVGKNDVLIKAAYDMKDGFSAVNLTVLAALTAKDEAYRARSADVINANRLKYGNAVEVIDKLETSEEGKGLIKDLKDDYSIRKKRQRQGHGVVQVREDRGSSRLICDRQSTLSHQGP